MQIEFDIHSSGKEGEFAEALQGIQHGFERASRDAANKAAIAIRKNAFSKIGGTTGRYNIAINTLKERSTVVVRTADTKKMAAGSNNVAGVSFSGANIPLGKFAGYKPHDNRRNTDLPYIPVPFNKDGKMAWRMMRPGIAVTSSILRGVGGTTFNREPGRFVAVMSSGHQGIFERVSKTNHGGVSVIKEKYATSVAGMIGQESVREELESIASETYANAMEHNVTAILNGSWKEYAGKHNSTSGRLQNIAKTNPSRGWRGRK